MTARPAHRARRLAATLTALITTAPLSSLAACSSDSGAAAEPSPTASETAAPLAEAGELRLGYFANLTHAIPLIGVADGTYQKTLGATTLTPTIFNAGPEAVEGIFSGAIDAAYVGPNRAI